jgi:surface polysaccharide O-acyltransferase-like enzyme
MFSESISTEKISPVRKYDRLAGVEWLRIIACFGIVWFHVKAPAAFVGYGGLPAFMIVSVSFAAMINKNLSAKEILISRFHRMGVPWLFWSMVYGLAKISQSLWEGCPISSEFTSSMVLFGPSIHLWYLPFGMFVTAIVSLAARKGYFKFDRMYVFLYVALASATLIVCSWLLPRMGNTVPFSQWIFIFPAIVIGLVFAKIPTCPKESLPYLLGTLAVLGVACLFAEITT